MRVSTLYISLIVLLLTSFARAEVIDLQAYLQQVRETHQGLQGDLLTRNGTELSSNDAALLTTPNLFSNITLMHDNKVDPLFQTNEQTRNDYSLGISDVTPYGLQGRVYYDFVYSHYQFINTSSLSLNQGRVSFELTQSLLRNGFGRETRAQIEGYEAAAKANSYAASYQSRVVLSQAESAYWSLSYARSAVKVTYEVLDRARKLYEWTDRREKLRLADNSDLLQADALMKLRQLDYQQAKDNERNASRSFNQFRAVDSDAVADQITELGPDLPVRLEAPQRAALREDVRSAQEQQIATEANTKVATEKTRATLDLFANLSLNGSDQEFAPTVSNSFRTDQPTVQAGVRFTMPLDFGLVDDSRRGYALQEQGAARTYQRRFFEQENEWHDLNQRLNEAKVRYELSRKVETIQKEKLKVERERLSRGKTTTFNVIQFEQDAAQSELNTLRAQNDILQVIAQLKTFGGPL